MFSLYSGIGLTLRYYFSHSTTPTSDGILVLIRDIIGAENDTLSRTHYICYEVEHFVKRFIKPQDI